MDNDGGISRLQTRMRAIPKAVKTAVQPALVKSAEELSGAMKHLAPVDSGDLKDSIQITLAGQTTPPYSQPGGSITVPENAVAITVGSESVRYPHLVEYGSTQANAQPFFWPSVRLYRTRISNRIKRAISKAVKAEWGKS